MDIASTSLFAVMKAKLEYGSARQSQLAQNVANADTPKYKAKDIQPPDFKKVAAAHSLQGQLAMATTNGRHLSGHTGGDLGLRTETRKSTDELNPNGNNVAIEDEMAKMSDNQSEYEKALNVMSAEVSMFKTAIDSTNTGG